MSRFQKLLLRSCAKGICIGWLLLAIILMTNIGGIREVIFSSSNAVLATFLLGVGFAITFGNAAMGRAVMTMPSSEEKIVEQDVQE